MSPRPLFLYLLLAAPLAHAGDCPWMSTDQIDKTYPDRAPWSVMAGGQGRCKFVSDQSGPASTISLTQILQASPQEAESYVKTVADGMAGSYDVKPLPAIGKNGASVRKQDPTWDMLTLIGHQKNVVVMTQMNFYKGIDDKQQAAAVALTQETFGKDTGGGLVLPKPKEK